MNAGFRQVPLRRKLRCLSSGGTRGPFAFALLECIYGLILVSGVLDFGPSGIILATICRMSALFARLHGGGTVYKKLPPDLQSIYPGTCRSAGIRQGAKYASASATRQSLPADDRKKSLPNSPRLTGLSPQVIEGNHLRIDKRCFPASNC